MRHHAANPPVPGEYVEEGVASWYGDPFNGHRTSNGEIYDMYQFTAAHRTLPFNAVVLRVTNLTNGKQTEVRINDRGPFVGNRMIDLSLSAARAIEMVGPGTAHVRLEMISGPNPAVGGFGVQVGAFLVKENAEALTRETLESRYLAGDCGAVRFAKWHVFIACAWAGGHGGSGAAISPISCMPASRIHYVRRAARQLDSSAFARSISYLCFIT